MAIPEVQAASLSLMQRRLFTDLAKREYGESGASDLLHAVARKKNGFVEQIRREDEMMSGEQVVWDLQWRLPKKILKGRTIRHRKQIVSVTIRADDPEHKLTVQGKKTERVGRFGRWADKEALEAAVKKAVEKPEERPGKKRPSSGKMKKVGRFAVGAGLQLPLTLIEFSSLAAFGLSALRLGLYGEPWMFPQSPVKDIPLAIPLHWTKFALRDFTPGDIHLHLPLAIEPVAEAGSAIASSIALRRIDTRLKKIK